MTLNVCMAVSALLFAIGAFGLLTRRNMIAALMSLELMVNAALINFVALARFGNGMAASGWDAEAGPVFALFAVAVTAAEMALALAIVIALRRQRRSLDIVEMDGLHG